MTLSHWEDLWRVLKPHSTAMSLTWGNHQPTSKVVWRLCVWELVCRGDAGSTTPSMPSKGGVMSDRTSRMPVVADSGQKRVQGCVPLGPVALAVLGI